jgi:hypothetical protein
MPHDPRHPDRAQAWRAVHDRRRNARKWIEARQVKPGYIPGMTDETDLETVERHVCEGIGHIKRQREIIADLEVCGSDTTEALQFPWSRR